MSYELPEVSPVIHWRIGIIRQLSRLQDANGQPWLRRIRVDQDRVYTWKPHGYWKRITWQSLASIAGRAEQLETHDRSDSLVHCGSHGMPGLRVAAGSAHAVGLEV